MEKNKLRKCGIFLIGGSAGSIEVVLEVLQTLDFAISFPIVVILHRGSASDSVLAELLSFKTSLPIREVEDKDVIKPGVIYMAPPDYHLLFEKNKTFSLDISEKINYSRPSIDVSFESAAEVYGTDTVALLLSGANSDGTDGLLHIKKRRGITCVQDPLTARVPYMPRYALENSEVDHILATDKISLFIKSFISNY